MANALLPRAAIPCPVPPSLPPSSSVFDKRRQRPLAARASSARPLEVSIFRMNANARAARADPGGVNAHSTIVVHASWHHRHIFLLKTIAEQALNNTKHDSGVTAGITDSLQERRRHFASKFNQIKQQI